MKKIKVFIGLIILNFCFSCSDLDLAPISTIATSSMWRTTDDANSAKIGMYYLFRDAFADDYQWYTETRTGFYKFGKSFYERYRAHMDNQLDAASLGADWGNFYTLINQCNLIFKYVPDIEFVDKEAQNQILAEAHFMRAFTYFWLVRIWGEVPVVTIPFESDDQEGLYPEREPESVVWDLIKSDLADAVSLYPSESNEQPDYIADLASINMLKTDVYLWLYKVNGENEALSLAEESVNAVLANSSFGLETNFRDIFRNEANQENIFTIYRNTDESGSSWFNLTIWRDGDVPEEYHNNPVPVGADNVYAFTDLAWNLVYEDPKDQRAEETIDSVTISGDVYEWGEKYSGEYTDRRRWDQNQHIYRFAEALLYKAEIENAKNNTASAVDYLNQVAERAYGISDYYSPTLSKAEVDDVILEERAKEFFFEGKYWWDLIRFDEVFEKVPTLAGRENEQNVLLWPVAFNTINRNEKITQTPGY